jgi:para-nitrobenzyl esterase
VPEVNTAYGRVRGQEQAGIHIFRGLPYARPPVGELRFAAPAPPERWDGVRDAVAFGPAAPQAAFAGRSAAASAGDDWLTLNIWTPAVHNDGLPVFTWIHGGAYRSGSSSQPGYDGTALAQHGMVVVTCNYRLGVEGFAQLADAPANRGLLDVVAALRWIAENVRAFGGDPANVTVAGESAGAGLVAALLAMPSADGLFSHAIVSSLPGTFLSTELAADVASEIGAEAGVGPAERQTFAKLPPSELSAAGDAVGARMSSFSRWGQLALCDTMYSPVVDGEVLPRAPWRAVMDGASRGVRLLIGHTRDEYRIFLAMSGRLDKITEQDTSALLEAFAPSPSKYRFAYPSLSAADLYERLYSDWLFRMPTLHLAQAHAVGGGTAYLYELTCPAPAAPELGSCHSLDVPMVFGVTDPNGISGQIIGQTPGESFTALSDLMRSEWASFAATGSPGWEPYTAAHRTARVYGDPASAGPYPEHTSMHLWERHVFEALPLLPDLYSRFPS